MTTALEKSILATLVYFDIFDYPLTLVEAHKFALSFSDNKSDFSLSDARNILEHSEILSKNVRFKDGFFYLRSKEKNLGLRHERSIIAKKKFDSIMEIINMLKRMPFVRAIFACNSLSFNNARKESDIDLVIISRRGGAWWARMFCLLMISFLRRRPGQKSAKDKVCLSVFVDEDHLDFSRMRMGKRDIDFSYWVCCFYPLCDSAGLYKKFWRINQEWLLCHLSNALACAPHKNRVMSAKPFLRLLAEFILLPFGRISEAMQKAKLPKNIRDIMNQDTRVMVEDGLLKFHVNDRRIEHLEAFVEKYESIVKNF